MIKPPCIQSKLKVALYSVAAVFLTLFNSGCAIFAPPTSPALKPEDLAHPTSQILGSSTPYYRVFIPSHSALPDKIFCWQSAVFGPSRSAATVADAISRAQKAGCPLVIGGPNPQRVHRILYDALRSLHPPVRATIVWVAPDTYSSQARRLRQRFSVDLRLASPP